MRDLSQQFLSDSRAFLSQDYLPKIERCMVQLTEAQIWSRGNNASNSIGNLLLHLAGSSRYWAGGFVSRSLTSASPFRPSGCWPTSVRP